MTLLKTGCSGEQCLRNFYFKKTKCCLLKAFLMTPIEVIVPFSEILSLWLSQSRR